MERVMGYVLGYYDAVVTGMKETEIPQSQKSIIKMLNQICDESSMFDDAVREIGAEVLANRILAGESYEQ